MQVFRGELAPWTQSALFLTTVVVGLFVLYEFLPETLRFQTTPQTKIYILCAIGCLYLFQVASTYRTLLQSERKVRNLETAFKYDKRGTLYNGREPNIAFRVVTFKTMLEGLSDEVGTETLRSVLIRVGKRAALDFASKLASIYDKDVFERGGASSWSHLSCEQKVDAWTEYDSATGWGIVTAVIPKGEDRITITITHLRELFAGDEGLHFAWFLAGYCETVLTKILDGHVQGSAPGRYRDFSRAALQSTVQKNAEIVEFSYRWV